MGGCLHVRELGKPCATKPTDYVDMREYLLKQMDMVQELKNKRKADIEKAMRRAERGGVDTSEEQDQVDVEKHSLNHVDSDGIQSMSTSNVHGLRSSQPSQQSGEQYNLINNQDKGDNNNEEYIYNCEDELEKYFGGEKAEQKRVQVPSRVLISIPEVRPAEENLKKFNNTIFQKADDSDDNNFGNIFSDNDVSFDDRNNK